MVLLTSIAAHYKIPIAVGAVVTGKINFLRLSDKTPREAIEVTASAIDATATEQNDGSLIVTPKAEPKPVAPDPGPDPTLAPMP